MFNETGCVPGIDGEEVRAEAMVPDAKEYISESIDNPEVPYDSADMGYTWVYAGSFVAGTKMASEMPQARTSRQ